MSTVFSEVYGTYYNVVEKADQYKENAPAAKSNTNAASNAAANAQKSTGWGSAMRTMGMLAVV